MQDTFQCPNCSSNNLIGQTFCVSCGKKLEYNCPHCGNSVDPSLTFCTSCSSTLEWPGQQLSESLATDVDTKSQEAAIDSGHRPKKNQTSKNQRPIGLIVLIVVLLAVAGLIFATDIFDFKLFTSNTPQEPTSTTPPPQTPPAKPVVTPTIFSFDASPAEILLGESSKLIWNTVDAALVTIEPNIGEVPLSGELSISPETSITYTLKAVKNNEIVTESISITVIENVSALDIVLTEDDVKPAGFEFNTHSEPIEEDTISTFHVIFNRGNETFGASVYVFNDISAAEEFYLEIKYNNRGNITGTTTIGDVGYFLTFTDDSSVPETYSIRFIKNNVYTNITGLKDFDELESFGKVIESRIH